MNAGDILTIEAAELVAGGEALARADGLPIFIPNLFPGDIAQVRITDSKKGYARAELVTILQPSRDRRLEPCPIANECGGCDWTALRLDRQLEWKKHILLESLRRVGKLDPATVPPPRIHPSPLNYRIRSRLHTDETGSVGFFATGSHRVIPIVAECEVVGPNAAVTLPDIESDSDDIHAWEVDDDLILLTPDDDPARVTISSSGFTWQLSTDAFFQVNRHLLPTMIRLVTELAQSLGSRRHAIDLYSGVGFFTAPLAKVFENVTAVEGAREAHAYARGNVPANVRLLHSPVEAYANRMEPADLIFLDPPRSGARREVIDAIAKNAGEMICFLACDPVTFARDAARLSASGWRLQTLDILDLFPNTHHIETLSSFMRAG